MTKQTKLGGRFTLPGHLNHAWTDGLRRDATGRSRNLGPPRDVDAAIAVLREAVAPA